MRRLMTQYRTNGTRGVTLTELLVVMVIITLLSTLILLVYVNRMEQARISVATGECRELAHAQEMCALIHGYYVPLQVLDDRPAITGVSSVGDVITLEDLSNIRLVHPLIPPQFQQGNQPTLASDLPRIREMRLNWQGPFTNIQRAYVGNEDPRDPNFQNSPTVRLDFPLDPWGNPYRFYSPIGIIGTNANRTDYTNLTISFSDGLITTQDDRNFERYAIVSWGRNNESDLNTPTDRDDIIHLFGSGGVESNFALP